MGAVFRSCRNRSKLDYQPHSLFNNLNSLSSLITSDAERFLDELSSVYRYLLRQNSRDLCPLAEEMHFIKAYFHLLKTRHGDGIFLETTLESQHLNYLIPPLTLQIVFENAIKHNVILVNRPLTIKVYVRNGNLYVENKLQKKKIAVQSNHIGL